MIWIGVVLIAVALVLYIYVDVIIPFNKTHEYIKMEMNRSCSRSEYKYWKKEMRKLYVQLIPVVRWFVKQ